MPVKHPNETTTIIIQPSSWKKKTFDAAEEVNARRLIREEVLLKRSEPYYQVRARIQHRDDGSVERIIAYMLRANTYTADLVEIKTTDSYGVASIKEGPDVVDDDEDAPGYPMPRSADYADIDIVCATPVPEIQTAKNAVLRIAEMAQAVGLRVRTIMGAEASVAAYQGAITSGIKAFFSVGHGYTGGIVLVDGNLTASWLSGVTERQVAPAVVYFNSCQVFNPPMQPSVMSAGARTFVGGIINLLIGPSEEVAMEFWRRVLQQVEQIGPALRATEAALYPVANAHGVSGDLGAFGTTLNQAIFYEHANYAGRSRALGIGRYDLNQIGLPNDCISSLRVPKGVKVTLFQHAGFGGNSITFTDNASFVGSFNDQTSSIVIERANQTPSVDIYEHVDFQGMRKQLGVGRYNTRDIGLPNDFISSIRVGPGLKATLYQHQDFQGASVSYIRDTTSVGSFNDQTSSIIIERIRTPVVEVYEHADFTGRCNVLGIGDYNMTQIGLPNDSLSSLKIPAGYEVTLYEHANFGGASVRYTRSTSFVGSFNDKTSSIRVRPRRLGLHPQIAPSESVVRGETAPAGAPAGA